MVHVDVNVQWSAADRHLPSASTWTMDHGPCEIYIWGSVSFRWRRWSGPGKFCCIYCDVQLYLGQFRSGLSVCPGRGPFEGYLDAGDVAVIRIVDLRGDTADRSIHEAHQANQKTGLIEIQIHGGLPRVRPLEHLDVTIIDGSRSHPPLIERLFKLRGKQQHRFNLRALQIPSAQGHQRHRFVR